MPQYLVAIHHPDDYDPSVEDEVMGRDIDVLNEEMVAEGNRVFVGGLHPVKSAKSLRAQPGGKVPRRMDMRFISISQSIQLVACRQRPRWRPCTSS